MRLTRKRAIELCIELWEWLAETGREKEDWPRWEEFGDILSHCWLCEYDRRQCIRYHRLGEDWYCYYCPYNKKFGRCDENSNTLYSSWSRQDNEEGSKKYAKLFLAQIKQCK